MASLPAVDIVGLTKTYGNRNALDDLSLRVERGSRTVVLGHNGAGKSTLLEIITTLRTPTSGTVTVEGHETVQRAREARRLIGLTPQSNALDPLATPAEVIEFQGTALGLDRRNAARRTRELLDLFGLTEQRGTRISRLSGGTRRKVDLAVALVAEPPVVILDEPTTGLDPLSRLDFWDELKRLNQGGSTLLVSTQDLHEADVLATDIAGAALIGYRPESWLSAIVVILLMLALGLGIALLSVAVAIRTVSMSSTNLVTLAVFGVSFFTGVFAPVDELAGWMRPIAILNPLTYVIDAARQFDSGATPSALPIALVVLGVLVVAGTASCAFALNHARRNR